MSEKLPRPGVRFALVCPKPDCNQRRFSEPRWVCPEHDQAVVQKNRPYFGQSTV